MVKTYIPMPNLTTAPPPNGPLHLGHIVKGLTWSSLESPLNQEGLIEIPRRPEPDTKEGFRKTRSQLYGGEFGIFAKFLALFGVGAEAEANFERSNDDILTVKTLETVTFAPSDTYVSNSMAADGVAIYMEAYEYKMPVFMITGMKIARGSTLENSRGRKFGWKLRLGFSHPGVPAEVGPKVGLKANRSEGESYESSSDFILAIRLKKIKYKEGKLVTEEYNKGATMMDDATGEMYSLELEDTGDDIVLEDVGYTDMELHETSQGDGDEPSYLALPKEVDTTST